MQINTIRDFIDQHESVAVVAEAFVYNQCIMTYLDESNESDDFTALVCHVQLDGPHAICDVDYDDIEKAEFVECQIVKLTDEEIAGCVADEHFDKRCKMFQALEKKFLAVSKQMIINSLDR